MLHGAKRFAHRGTGFMLSALAVILILHWREKDLRSLSSAPGGERQLPRFFARQKAAGSE
jgi:hypothetical protein